MVLVANSPLTTLYRARLAGMRAALLMRIAAGWGRVFDPAAPIPTLQILGHGVGVWTVAAQQLAAAEAVGYLTALIAQASGQPLLTVTPFAIPSGLIGTSAAGGTVSELTEMAPAVYLARLNAGWASELASQSALAWLNRVAASEPSRAANTTVMRATVDDDRFTGRYRRITRPDACEWCKFIADRGYIEARAGFDAHTHCACDPEPEPSLRVYSRRARQRARRAT
jgi:hypothetical protein